MDFQSQVTTTTANLLNTMPHTIAAVKWAKRELDYGTSWRITATFPLTFNIHFSLHHSLQHSVFNLQYSLQPSTFTSTFTSTPPSTFTIHFQIQPLTFTIHFNIPFNPHLSNGDLGLPAVQSHLVGVYVVSPVRRGQLPQPEPCFTLQYRLLQVSL